MTIGDRIRIKREELGYTQTEFAKMIGVSKQTLYKYENGIVTNIPSSTIEKIAEKLRVSESYLMGWENNLTESNADLLPDLLADENLMKHIKMLMELNKEHQQTIFDNITYWYEKEGH